MKRTPRICLFAAILCLAVAATASAQSPVTAQQQASQYALGDQTLTIGGGFFVPLFLIDPSNGSATALLVSSAAAGDPAQLSLGGIGSLSWAAYVTPQIRIGVDVAGTFAFSPNANTLLMLPIVARATYAFSVYPFEVPLSFGVKSKSGSVLDATVTPFLVMAQATVSPAVSELLVSWTSA